MFYIIIFLLHKENKPIGTSILQMSVIDQDSSHNGPPFDFRILSGNEGGEFVLEKDGTLVANHMFRRDLATEYVLQIQVALSTSHHYHYHSYTQYQVCYKMRMLQDLSKLLYSQLLWTLYGQINTGLCWW